MDRDPVFAGLGGVSGRVDEFLAVGRERHIGVDISDELLGSTTQHGSAIEIVERVAADVLADEIQVVAVRREAQTNIDGGRGRYDLGVAAGWNVAQPQASLAV